MNAPVRIDLRDVSTFPTRRVEAWRYSDLRRAAPAPVAPVVALAGTPAPGVFDALVAPETPFANGRRSDGARSARLEGGGVRALRFVTAAETGGWEAEVAVVVAEGETMVLLESYEGTGAYVSNVRFDIRLEPGATLERVVVMDEPERAVSVSIAEVRLSPGARFGQTVVATGAALQRHETTVAHPGAGALARLDGVYLLDGTRHSDLTTVVSHDGPGGETSQLAKGVVAGAARGVFQGRIVVAPGADGTDARMRHDARLLSDRAEVDAKPELEIYADDVACAHGNTVGALDADALFYARSRGIPEAAAKALLTQAFVGEAIDRIEHTAAREVVRAWAFARLEALG